jgi:hypothetical protein
MTERKLVKIDHSILIKKLKLKNKWRAGIIKDE